jgi:hypothetical protein
METICNLTEYGLLNPVSCGQAVGAPRKTSLSQLVAIFFHHLPQGL